MHQDLCNKQLGMYEFNELPALTLCHECNIRVSGPNKAAYFMSKWNKKYNSNDYDESSKKKYIFSPFFSTICVNLINIFFLNQKKIKKSGTRVASLFHSS